MGEKASDEIKEYLLSRPYIQSINVIGFSLGGVIARAMLKGLEQYKDKFNLFLTLASPHLGIS